MFRNGRTRLGLLIILAGSLISCLDETPDTSTIPKTDIPAPTNIDVLVGDGQMTISWDSDGSFAYTGFAVFRSTNDGATWNELGRVPASTNTFVDSTVRVGTVYLFRVSGIGQGNVVGLPSESITVVAGVYSMFINSGQNVTGQRQVQIILNAPTSTRLARLSEDSLFTNVEWFDYQGTVNFTLSVSDGLKEVFAQFADFGGAVTEPISSSIVLDTGSRIESASMTTPQTVPPGATIHVIITPAGNELGGSASVSVQGLAGSFSALDDGTAGDTVSEDGVYERDFVLPLSFRQTGSRISATFTDKVGNRSEPVEFIETLSIVEVPVAVTLLPVVDSTATSISLRWTRSDDLNFAFYELYRDLTPTVSRDVSPKVGTFGNAAQVTYDDTGLDEAETYYYVIYVINDLDEFAGSNVRMAQTADVPPTPVVCDTPSSVSASSVTLTWSQNENTDFEEYRIYRAQSPGVTEASTLVTTITDRLTTFYDDIGVSTSTTYFYRVFVYDKAGNSARSNEVTTTTP